MRIELKRDRCMAHGVCMEVAPAYFEPDEEGYVALRPGAIQLGDHPDLRLAEMNCPMQAIVVHDAPTSAREE
jgi:ferredoxin